MSAQLQSFRLTQKLLALAKTDPSRASMPPVGVVGGGGAVSFASGVIRK